jgi:hypothetical protein
MMRSVNVERALAIYAQQRRCVFSVDGQEEPSEFLFAPEAFLPIVAAHAMMDAQYSANLNLGLIFSKDTSALMQVTVTVPPLTGDEASVLRLAFFSGAAQKIFGLEPNTRIECRPVFDAYKDGLLAHVNHHGVIQWPLSQSSRL